MIAILTTSLVNVSEVKRMANVPMVVMDKSGFPIVSDFLLIFLLSFVLAAVVEVVLAIIFIVINKKDSISNEGEKNE